MLGTQIVVPDKLYRRIQLQAAKKRVDPARMIRQLLERGLRQPRVESAGHALLRLARIGGGGPSDLSRRIDDYLYESES